VGRALRRGDALRIEALGRPVELRVTRTVPRGEAVFVEPTTTVELSEQAAGDERLRLVNYEDIGGLREPLARLREMVELPLKRPELFQKLGLEPPRGVLLHGPPGTGKTLLARAVASEAEAAFFHLSGPEVLSKFYGQSEENLRELFREAGEKSPAIIFIDEIDALAPKRDEVGGELERRLVSQLLTLMDGLEDRGQVVVIGATNRPDALDEALRRPGRFDRELTIGMPDVTAREEILEIHFRGTPRDEAVNLQALARQTHGFTGADLAALAREAGMRALRRAVPEVDGEIDDAVLENLRVEPSDVESALRELSPSALREVVVETPTVRWDDVGGLAEAKQRLQETAEWPLKYRELFRHFGAKPARGLLLHGPPGTGKTLLARALATEAEVNFLAVKGPELMSKWVGESEKAVRRLFTRARQVAPAVVFLDEVESLAPLRGSTCDAGATERVVAQLLTELDGLQPLHNVLVIGATNRADLIDPALLRPGRFDELIYIGLPDEAARREILEIHLREAPLARTVEPAALAKQSEGYSGADLAGAVREAVMEAVRELVLQDHTTGQPVARARVRPKHLAQGLERYRPERYATPRDVKMEAKA